MYRQNFKSAQFVKKDTDQSIEASSENNETSVAKEASGADILKGFRIIYNSCCSPRNCRCYYRKSAYTLFRCRYYDNKFCNYICFRADNRLTLSD